MWIQTTERQGCDRYRLPDAIEIGWNAGVHPDASSPRAFLRRTFAACTKNPNRTPTTQKPSPIDPIHCSMASILVLLFVLSSTNPLYITPVACSHPCSAYSYRLSLCHTVGLPGSFGKGFVLSVCCHLRMGLERGHFYIIKGHCIRILPPTNRPTCLPSDLFWLFPILQFQSWGLLFLGLGSARLLHHPTIRLSHRLGFTLHAISVNAPTPGGQSINGPSHQSLPNSFTRGGRSGRAPPRGRPCAPAGAGGAGPARSPRT